MSTRYKAVARFVHAPEDRCYCTGRLSGRHCGWVPYLLEGANSMLPPWIDREPMYPTRHDALESIREWAADLNARWPMPALCRSCEGINDEWPCTPDDASICARALGK